MFSQSDRPLKIAIQNQYSIDRLSANENLLKIYSSEAIIKREKYTYVPTYRNKSLNGATANQFGASVYKGFEKSYLNIASYFSDEELFPNWQFSSNFYKGIGKGIEARIAYDYRTYDDTGVNHMAIIGVSYEKRKMLYQYNAYQPINQGMSHQFSVRKVLKKKRDFLQLSYTNGQENRETSYFRTKNQLASYGLSGRKKISDKIQLTLATSLTNMSKNNERRLYSGSSIGLGIELYNNQ